MFMQVYLTSRQKMNNGCFFQSVVRKLPPPLPVKLSPVKLPPPEKCPKQIPPGLALRLGLG